jgi:hypothetical protein
MFVFFSACYTVEAVAEQYYSLRADIADCLGFYYSLFLCLGKVHGCESSVTGHMTKAERAGR